MKKSPTLRQSPRFENVLIWDDDLGKHPEEFFDTETSANIMKHRFRVAPGKDSNTVWGCSGHRSQGGGP